VAVFGQYFSRVVLVTKGSSVPESGGDADQTFSRDDEMEFVFLADAAAGVSVCIGEARGGGKVIFSRTLPVLAGQTRLAIGRLDSSPYVARIAVDSALVKNIAFTVK